MNKRGVALYFVLAILLVVIIFANIILNFINSQSKFTNHQVRRVQAYYAAQAGVNFALEKLRLNNATWNTTTAAKTFRICGSNYNITNPALCNGTNITEPSFPVSINYIDITIGPLDAATNSRSINSTVNYTSNS